MNTPMTFMRKPERVLAMRVAKGNLKDICDWINATGQTNGCDFEPSYGIEGALCWVGWEQPWGSETAEEGEWVVYRSQDRNAGTFERLDRYAFEMRWEQARVEASSVDNGWWG